MQIDIGVGISHELKKLHFPISFEWVQSKGRF